MLHDMIDADAKKIQKTRHKADSQEPRERLEHHKKVIANEIIRKYKEILAEATKNSFV